MFEEENKTTKNKKREREILSDESGSDIDIDDELRLPDDLSLISKRERKELYLFKKTHTEIEYENEVMRRIELLQPKKDLERLKKMTEGVNMDESSSTTKRGGTTRKSTRTTTKKSRPNIVEDEVEEQIIIKEPIEPQVEQDEESEVFSQSSSDDDLFGEDEINEITASRNNNTQQVDNNNNNNSTNNKVDNNDDIEIDDDDEDNDEDGNNNKKTNKKNKTKGRLRKGEKVIQKPKKKKKTALDLYEEEEYNEESQESSDNDDNDNKDNNDNSDDDNDDNITRKDQNKKRESSNITSNEEKEVDNSPLAELVDYQRIQTRRLFIEQWISEPFFDNVVKGSFVRLFVGVQDDVQIYRMCEVLDVLPYKRSYRLPGTELTIDRALLVGLGSSQKVAKMYHVSNSRITDKEFQYYVNMMKSSRDEDKLLRKNEIEKRKKRIAENLVHTYTNEEIQSMVEKNAAKNKALTTTNANALKILEYRLASARAEEDFDEMEKLQKDIEKIKREIDLSKELYVKNYGVLTDLNKRNKSLNVQIDMQAAERRRIQEQELMARGGAKNLVDPFARRETRPQILWLTGKKKTKEDGNNGDTDQNNNTQNDNNSTNKIISTNNNDSNEEEKIHQFDLDSNPEQIGKRIQDRYGFNPYTTALLTRKERYLLSVCEDLPPIGSYARESIRKGLSLAKYRESMCGDEDS